MRRIAGERVEGAFGGRVGGEKRLPAIADIEEILTIVPARLSLRIKLIAPCIRKNGARTLIAKILSYVAGAVPTIVPRLVSPAALTSASTRLNARSHASTI